MWDQLRIGHCSSPEQKPWLGQQVVCGKGVVECATLWADVHTSCMSQVFFVRLLKFDMSNIQCQ